MTATLTSPERAPTPGPARRPSRSRTELICLTLLLAGTAALLLADLGATGYANDYYAAAVQAMTRSPEAFFFGSLDAGNVVTVDKPPAALWVMAASARLFGFSSWSMLVPQALMGVGSVALLYAAVRRVSGWVPALLAGAVLALTPVAAVMFRFNNPDALLVLLMVAAAYATVRAIERASTRWLLLAGVFIGLAFLAKMGQALIVLPALVLAYLVAAPTGPWRRVRQLFAAGVAVVVSAGWYVAIVESWPSGTRPYIGGSTGDSFLQLALGYNGLGRIFGGFGDHSGGDRGAPPELPAGVDPTAGGFPGGGGFGGQAGLTRLFNTEIGGQISWLLPAALALLLIGLWLTRSRPRTDPVRASLLLWGGWALVTMVVFSFAAGIFHGYYTVALAPAVGALIGIGAPLLWRHRHSWPGRIAAAALVAGTAGWAWVLLERTPTFLPWLRWTILAVAAVVVLALVLQSTGRRLAVALALGVTLVGLAGPTAYAVQTAATPHNGSMPTAGPAMNTERFDARAGTEQRHMGGGPGESRQADPALIQLLRGAGTRWSAATVGAMGGASLALTSGTNVMMIGGFSGSDPVPTLQAFQGSVSAGEVHYFVAGGEHGPGDEEPGGPGRAEGTSAQITTWVQQHFKPVEIGGRTVYDLTQPS